MPVFQTNVLTYGSISVTRDELTSFRTECKIDLYLAERVNQVSRVTPQSNDFDYIYMALIVNSSKFSQWAAYFDGAPAGIQQDLVIPNLLTGAQFICESMAVQVAKAVNDSTGQYQYVYKLDLTLVRAI